MAKITNAQADTMHAACTVYPRWFRARSSGERVTLASLARNGMMERRQRADRKAKSSADMAFEYRPVAAFVEAAKKEGLLP